MIYEYSWKITELENVSKYDSVILDLFVLHREHHNWFKELKNPDFVSHRNESWFDVDVYCSNKQLKRTRLSVSSANTCFGYWEDEYFRLVIEYR